MKIALLEPTWDDEPSRDTRYRDIDTVIRASASDGAQIVVLPELWTVGAFSVPSFYASAEPIPGPTTRFLSELARTLGIWVAGGSIVESASSQLFNTSLLFDPSGELVATYRKIHLFGFASGEADVLTAGNEVVVVPTPLGLTGISTCYDLRFPELYREQRRLGADTFIIGSGWPQSRVQHWDTLIKARAIENQAYVLGANSGGTSVGIQLGGSSQIVSPTGESIGQRVPGDLVGTVTGHFSIDSISALRSRFPVNSDRRPDLLG